MVHAMAVNPIAEMHAPDFDRNAMSQATRLIQPCVTGVSPLQQLLGVPAAWTIVDTQNDQGLVSGPRLRSPRYRGIAPVFPVDHAMDMHQGMLVVFPGGFVLEPADPCCPCLHVPCSMVKVAIFYRDAIDVALCSQNRLVIWTEAIEDIDSIFQAYFWNPVM